MTPEDLKEKLINELISDIPVPPRSEVLNRFIKEKNNPKSSIEDFAQIISSDMAIALALLKTVNSVFFGLTHEVKSVSHAISMLGLQNVENLVLAFALKHAFVVKDSTTLTKFWDENNSIALVAASLASTYTSLSSDQAFTFSIICECGIPAMMSYDKTYEEFYLRYKDESEGLLIDKEESTFMLDHARVGAYMLKEWLIPDQVILAIKYHHTYFRDKIDAPPVVGKIISLQMMAKYIWSNYHRQEPDMEWKRYHTDVMKQLGIEERALPMIEQNFALLLDNF